MELGPINAIYQARFNSCGREWDRLLAADRDSVLVNAMNTTPGGQFQTYATEPGAYIREHFFGSGRRLRALVANLGDAELERLPHGSRRADPARGHQRGRVDGIGDRR
jgi:pyruvate dehydrogenase complex dehydrogenase (E1) component